MNRHTHSYTHIYTKWTLIVDFERDDIFNHELLLQNHIKTF